MNNIINKKTITDEIKNCKKSGYEIIIFQTDKQKRAQEKGMTDYFLTGAGSIMCFELKLPGDILSDLQKRILRKLFIAMKSNERVFAGVIDIHNYKTITEKIIARDWKALKNELVKTEVFLYK